MKLICPECRRENEPERIYCHDCGARLDRSTLRREQTKEEDPKETQRRLRTMLDPRRALLKRQIFQGCKAIALAFMVAAIVQMVREPDLPESAKKTGELLNQINLELEDAVMDPAVRPPLNYSEEQVNAYLAYTLKSKEKALSSYLRFGRVVAAFDEGIARVTVQRSIFGYAIYSTVAFEPKLEKRKLTARIVGGSLGRMPIHPALMQYSDFMFSDVRKALDRDARNIAKLGGIEVHPKRVTFILKQPLL